MTATELVLKSTFDDLNLAEASLISCLTRLKPGENSWRHSFVIAGRSMNVECLGNAYGFPHGSDSDVMVLLTNLYLEAGKPADNSVQCTAYTLLKRLGRSDSSQNYRILHDSLTRLSGTMYKISGWLDQPGGSARRVTFRFIERIEEIQNNVSSLNLQPFGSGTQLRITLDQQVASSLHSPRVRTFDFEFMLKLPGSQSRMLFRLLDTLWFSDPQASRSGVLEFGVVELGKLLRLTNLRPDSIRRTIIPIHQELIASEFLKDVEFVGRGAGQQVRYVFNPQRPDYPLSAEQLELVGRIANMDVPNAQARHYVRKLPTDRARERIQLAEQILAATTTFRKGRGAYAWDILQDESGKYAAPAHRTAVKALEATPSRRESSHVEAEAQEAFEAQKARALLLTPAEQWEASRSSLKLLLGKPLGAARWKSLEQRCLSGRLSAESILRDANRAMAGLTIQDFITQLSQALDAD
ncbi:replication initiator protein A (plasmid) [Deinococcus taeanensis]|uniref:replication initiator protein A n=1 Tax=Deinococcus taeanensis TaxID=2737050 RepID=UPI001CDC3CD1|nr:replication initiator protein A [Deinococcus taeanensis]UBV44086.1 replication initiator protein A [Deinococcus taeanensis]